MTAQVVTAFAGIDVVGSGETPWMKTMIAAQSNADLDDFMVITAGNREITHVQAYGNGTQVITVKAGDR